MTPHCGSVVCLMAEVPGLRCPFLYQQALLLTIFRCCQFPLASLYLMITTRGQPCLVSSHTHARRTREGTVTLPSVVAISVVAMNFFQVLYQELETEGGGHQPKMCVETQHKNLGAFSLCCPISGKCCLPPCLPASLSIPGRFTLEIQYASSRGWNGVNGKGDGYYQNLTHDKSSFR